MTKEQNVYLSQMLLQITKRKKQNQNNNSKNKKVYLSQMLLYMDLKVLASSREGGVAPWAVHLFMFISLFFFLKIRDLSIVRLLLFLIFRFRMLRLL